MKSIYLKSCVCILSIFFAISCKNRTSKDVSNDIVKKGDAPEDITKQVAETHDNQINKAKQDECNAQGKFYDNFAKGDSCSEEFALATWPCTRTGWEGFLKTVGDDSSNLSIIDSLISDGFSFHQCGEGFQDINIIFVKQFNDDKTASTEIKRYTYSLPRFQIIFESSPGDYSDLKAKLGICTSVNLAIRRSSDGVKIPAYRDVTAELSGAIDPNHCGGDETATIDFFADNLCASKIKTVTIPNGSDSITFYVKPSGTGCYALEAKAPNVSETPLFSVDVN